MELNKIYNMDCIEGMKLLDDNSIDLTVTSPPYNNLRPYNGFTWDFESTAKEIYRVTKQGGVVVWVVGDATVNGNETGTSFKQALYFKELGFDLHDTMIYQKLGLPKNHNRYEQEFEYMFILSKGKLKTFNPIKIKNKQAGRDYAGQTFRHGGKETEKIHSKEPTKKERIKGNIWLYDVGYMRTTKDKIAYKHPAIFPEQLAQDHILSWSNEGDTVLDPFTGSGTTCKMAYLNKRNYIGIEISKEYCDISNMRIETEQAQVRLCV
jgi:site-specific DNA-methyltransferase (adenine-specific)